MPDKNYRRYSPRQLAGTEFGGTDSNNTVQPKGADALSASEELRLGYLVGDLSDSQQFSQVSLEDRRQMLGLKNGVRRPLWLANTGPKLPQAALNGAEYPDEYLESDETNG